MRLLILLFCASAQVRWQASHLDSPLPGFLPGALVVSDLVANGYSFNFQWTNDVDSYENGTDVFGNDGSEVPVFAAVKPGETTPFCDDCLEDAHLSIYGVSSTNHSLRIFTASTSPTLAGPVGTYLALRVVVTEDSVETGFGPFLGPSDDDLIYFSCEFSMLGTTLASVNPVPQPRLAPLQPTCEIPNFATLNVRPGTAVAVTRVYRSDRRQSGSLAVDIPWVGDVKPTFTTIAFALAVKKRNASPGFEEYVTGGDLLDCTGSFYLNAYEYACEFTLASNISIVVTTPFAVPIAANNFSCIIPKDMRVETSPGDFQKFDFRVLSRASRGSPPEYVVEAGGALSIQFTTLQLSPDETPPVPVMELVIGFSVAFCLAFACFVGVTVRRKQMNDNKLYRENERTKLILEGT